jgi:hypothetical protein
MLIRKCLPNCSSYSAVHEILTAQGFKKIGTEEHQIYQAEFRDTATQIKYYFFIPMRLNRQEEGEVSFGKMYFDRSKVVPQAVLEGVQGKLLEIADYLHHIRKPHHNRMKKGYMVRDHKELNKLGNEMSQMQTNTEVHKSGQVPDPIQYSYPFRG